MPHSSDAAQPHQGTSRKTKPIDQAPLKGPERRKYEDELLGRTKVKGIDQLVLRIVLDKFCRGRADCFPSNGNNDDDDDKSKGIAKEVGRTPRTIRNVIRNLEKVGALLCIVDRGIPSQRRLVMRGHPNETRVLSELAKSPFLVADNPDLDRYRVSERAPWEEEKRAPGEEEKRAPGEEAGFPRSALVLEAQQKESVAPSVAPFSGAIPDPQKMDGRSDDASFRRGNKNSNTKRGPKIPNGTIGLVRRLLGDRIADQLVTTPDIITATIGRRWEVLEYAAQQVKLQQITNGNVGSPIHYLIATAQEAIKNNRVPSREIQREDSLEELRDMVGDEIADKAARCWPRLLQRVQGNPEYLRVAAEDAHTLLSYHRLNGEPVEDPFDFFVTIAEEYALRNIKYPKYCGGITKPGQPLRLA